VLEHGRPGPRARRLGVREIDEDDILRTLDVPVLVTQGRADSVVLPAMAEHILAECATAEASWYFAWFVLGAVESGRHPDLCDSPVDKHHSRSVGGVRSGPQPAFHVRTAAASLHALGELRVLHDKPVGVDLELA
jgi:hypothetical protein